MFSSRSNWNITPNKITVLLEEKRLRGESIVDLTESNPTLCGFIYPEQEIFAALADQSSLLYQPEPRGLLNARIAVAEYYANLGVPVVPDQIFLTASTSEAYSFLFKLLCDNDDEVIVPRPGYPLFEYLCRLNDVTLRHYRLAYDGEWHIDFKSLQAQLSDRTRAIILVQPNNPTGSYLKQDEFARICSLAVDHQCAIIADEVFGLYAFSSVDGYTRILASDSPVLLFSLNGISKFLGLPQLKLAWIIVRGDLQRKAEAINRLDIIADTFLSVNTPVQVALPKLLQHSFGIGEQIRSRIHTNYQVLQKILVDSKLTIFQVEGGWYAILQLPQSRSDDEWAIILVTRLNILVHPGHFFDMEQKSCIVISLLQPSEIFERAIMQIRRFVEENDNSFSSREKSL